MERESHLIEVIFQEESAQIIGACNVSAPDAVKSADHDANRDREQKRPPTEMPHRLVGGSEFAEREREREGDIAFQLNLPLHLSRTFKCGERMSARLGGKARHAASALFYGDLRWTQWMHRTIGLTSSPFEMAPMHPSTARAA